MVNFSAKSKLVGVFSSLALLAACGSNTQSDSSDLKVVDGLEIPYTTDPSVVFIYNLAQEGEGGSVCTGTFVQPQLLLTAAHCTEYISNQAGRGLNEELEDEILILDWDETIDTDDDPSNGISGGFKRIATSSRIFRHPSINRRNIATVTSNDLAILYFEDYVSEATTPIASAQPRRGETATIIGFGADSIRPAADDDSVGTKRKGTITIGGVSNFITFRGPSRTTCRTDCGIDVNSGPGDSGGPMLVDGELVGVTSGGSFFSSSYVNINSRASRAFLDSVSATLEQPIR
ncbi:MAG: trypsin-like serine protease [Pseudobacteriovorax sp.]|nr:trypsin-like serine protease [Pseudobacteriovorax sp.]